MNKNEYFKAIIKLAKCDKTLFHDGIELDIIDLAEKGLKAK